jgi:hypothetical protein
MLKRFGGKDNSDEDEDDVNEEDIEEMYDQKWGKGKKSYYNTDVKSDNKVNKLYSKFSSLGQKFEQNRF